MMKVVSKVNCLITILSGILWAAPNALAEETYKLELEKFSGTWKIQQNIPGYSGSGFRTSNHVGGACPSPLTGKVNLLDGGDYIVWSRGYVNAPYRRGWYVEIAGQKLNPTHNDSSGGGFLWRKAGTIKNLKPGQYEILIQDADAGLETADEIIVTNDADFNPVSDEAKLRVLPADAKNETLVFEKFLNAISRNSEAQKVPSTKEQWLSEAPKVKEHLADALGLWRLPDSGELNARVYGKVICNGYSIEKVTFESLKDFVVTANVYIPDRASGSNKLPGVVVTCGHSMDLGKAYDTYQHVAAGLAKMGYVALIYDPMGQGERRVAGNSHDLNGLSTLVGLSAYGVMVRDSMAAVSYLMSRPEVDAEKIGLTGTSGGGGNTFFTMPFDERIKAAVVSSFATSYEHFLTTGWAHCPCNIVPGVAWDCEQWKILALDAPRPVLVHAGPQDYAFPVEGARESVIKAKKIYTFFNAVEMIDLYVGQDHQIGKSQRNEAWLGHSYHPPAREAMYGWFDKYLKGQGTGQPVPEPEHTIFIPRKLKQPGKPDEGIVPDELKVVKDITGLKTRTFRDIIATRAKQIDSRRRPVEKLEQWAARVQDIRDYLIKKLNIDFAAYSSQNVGETRDNGLNVRKWILTSPDGIPCAGLEIKVVDKAPWIVYVATAKNVIASDPVIRQIADAGINVFIFTPRAYDELGMANGGIVWKNPPGRTIRTGLLGVDCYLAGYSLLGQRVSDVVAAVKFVMLQRPSNYNIKVGLYAGMEETDQIAAVTGAVLPEISAMALKSPLLSYRAYLNNPSVWAQETMMVPNGYEAADIWETLALRAPKALMMINPQPDAVAEKDIRNVYRLYGMTNMPAILKNAEMSENNSLMRKWFIENLK